MPHQGQTSGCEPKENPDDRRDRRLSSEEHDLLAAAIAMIQRARRQSRAPESA